MIDRKPWYTSKTIWGALVAILATLASMMGFDLDSDAQADLVEAALQLVTAAGALVAIFGRLVATDFIE